jgi:hypothetical protein
VPIYFNDVAPFCPVSRDQPTGPSTAPSIRTTIPRAFDLASALAAANLARTIINQVINNVHVVHQPSSRTIDARKKSRWKEQTSSRVTRKYKYYVEDAHGNPDKDSWVMTERIEHMVWVDSVWRTSLTWTYGDKGEGEPQ